MVGLGNPGAEYTQTRHNIGVLFLETLTSSFTNDTRAHGLRASERLFGHPVELLLPQTYMNRSGTSVQAVTSYLTIPADHVIVVHDEADLPFGDVRVKFGGGHAGHNGIKSIQQHLGTPDFWRIRIGIGRPAHPDMPLEAHVLGRWTTEEQRALTDVFRNASHALEQLLT